MGRAEDILPGIKQFRSASSDGCLSYILYDRVTRQALILDPGIDFMGDYRDYLNGERLKLVSAVDTCTHWDHLSATHFLRAEFGCEIGMSHRSESHRPTCRLKSGDKIPLGLFELEVLETPGFTPDSIALLGAGMVFTGNALWIGSLSCSEAPGADLVAEWTSLSRVFRSLPDETLIFPGHDHNDLIFSTIGVEKKVNPGLIHENLERFLEYKNSECPPSGLRGEALDRVAYNLSARPSSLSETHFPDLSPRLGATPSAQPGQALSSIGVDKYSQKLRDRQKGCVYLDVREPDEFQKGHMPGVINIPLSEIGLHLKTFQAAKRVYVSCLSGRRSSMAAKTLSYLGLTDVVNVVGGYKAWQLADLSIEKDGS